MVIYLSGEIEDQLSLDELTPRQIVAELDKHVVGQSAAKRAVAVALRNRIRRQKLPADLARTDVLAVSIDPRLAAPRCPDRLFERHVGGFPVV